MGIGNLHHLAFTVSRATYTQAKARLEEGGFANSGEVDRGFMYSIYFRDPLGQLMELACYKFEPPVGATHADVLREAHNIRVAKGDYNIADEHLADAIELLSRKPEPKIRQGTSMRHWRRSPFVASGIARAGLHDPL